MVFTECCDFSCILIYASHVEFLNMPYSLIAMSNSYHFPRMLFFSHLLSGYLQLFYHELFFVHLEFHQHVHFLRHYVTFVPRRSSCV